MDESLVNGDFVPLTETSGYVVQKFLGHGAFGNVYLCMRSDTEEIVAVKAITKEDTEEAEDEVGKLEKIRELDPDKNCLVRFNRHLELQGNYFLEFEKLDMTVQEFLERSGRPLNLSAIQMITQQMLVALTALKSIKMVHGDIKTDNIMLINHQLQPCKVKLIDFGVAQNVSDLDTGDVLQLLPHRAPEVLLGLPLSEAVDMWALGSVIASLFISGELYSGVCELAKLDDIVQLHGQFDDQLLNNGLYTMEYFYKDTDSVWKLKTECCCPTGDAAASFIISDRFGVHRLLRDVSSRPFTSLDDIVMARPDTAGFEDTRAFISLIKQMLQVDPKQRITPSEALMHPFFTIKHFPSDSIKISSETNTAAENNDKTIHSELTCCSDNSPPEKAGSIDFKTKICSSHGCWGKKGSTKDAAVIMDDHGNLAVDAGCFIKSQRNYCFNKQ